MYNCEMKRYTAKRKQQNNKREKTRQQSPFRLSKN